jgi:hypothetical protein
LLSEDIPLDNLIMSDISCWTKGIMAALISAIKTPASLVRSSEALPHRRHVSLNKFEIRMPKSEIRMFQGTKESEVVLSCATS